MEVFGAVNRDNKDKATRFTGTTQDVSKRKWAEQLKGKNEELIKAEEKAEESE